MLQVFAGEDTFASYNAAREYASQLCAESGSELAVLDADDLAAPADLLRPLENLSLFGAGNVVLAKRLLANARLSRYLEDNLGSLLDKPLVIWHDRKLDARLGLTKTLKAKATVMEFSPLS